jgi:phage-related tail fiber protein
MSRTFNCTDEIIVVSEGKKDIGKIPSLGNDGKLDPSVLPEIKANAGVPAGAVQYFAMNKAPAGWLIADGATISRTNYVDLFAAIGTLYGEGDGSTTFKLPDLRGEFIRGFDNGRSVDAGRAFGSSQDGSLLPFDLYKDATWGLSEPTQNRSTALSSFNLDEVSGFNGDGKLSYAVQGGRLNNGMDGGVGVTRPRNVALLACIKY